MRPIDRAARFAGAIFVAAWFLHLAGAGLGAWFSGDDMMNLYGAWTTPWLELVRANVLFFGGEFRPFGALWYRAVFALAGFDPWWFHAAAFAILIANIAIAWLLARRLTGSDGTAAIAALLVSYNARFANLYFDTGAIYDVLCFFFYYAALLWYVRVRQRPAIPDVKELAVLAALTVCGLNSKEMAVTLPAAILLYELVWHPPRKGAVKKWIFDGGRGAIATGLIVLAFVAGKALNAASAMHAPQYAMEFTWARGISNAAMYLDDIFYRYGWFTPARTAALWLGMGAAAWLLRSKAMRYAWLLVAVTIAPMLFAAPRGGSAIYVCLFGWALYAAALTGRLLGPGWKRAAAFAALAAALYPLHRFEGGFTGRSAAESGERLRAMWRDLDRVRPRLAAGSRILFVNDPFDADVHDLMFLVRLGRGDDSIVVDRSKVMRDAPEWSNYEYVIDLIHGRFVTLRRPVQ